jgi:hypothetical protein
MVITAVAGGASFALWLWLMWCLFNWSRPLEAWMQARYHAGFAVTLLGIGAGVLLSQGIINALAVLLVRLNAHLGGEG